jgi:hypothetical protein
VKRSRIAPLPTDPLYGFGPLRTLPPRPFTCVATSTTVTTGTGLSTVAWQEMSITKRCLPMLRMMRFGGPTTGGGTVGAAWGKGITFLVMSGDCTSQPHSPVQSLAASMSRTARPDPLTPGLAWLSAFQLARSHKNAQPCRGFFWLPLPSTDVG